MKWLKAFYLAAACAFGGFALGVGSVGWMAAPAAVPGMDVPAWVGAAEGMLWAGVVGCCASAIGWVWEDFKYEG